MKKKNDSDLHASGEPCLHKCDECNDCFKVGCKDCKQIKNDCEKCVKNKPYELLNTSMVGAPSIIFTRYHEAGYLQ